MPDDAQVGASTITTSEMLATITVSSRIPEFWVDQPRLWFIQIEAILSPQKLSDEQRYNLVVAKLSKDAIAQITDFLAKPPDKTKYDLLKEKLLQVFEESEARKLHKLVGEMELGDQRPSQLLTKMTDLARGKVSEETLALLWQGHLPTAVRAVLTVSEGSDLAQLAKLADKVMENIQPSQNIAQVGAAAGKGESNSFILAEIAKINTRLDKMTASTSGPRRNFTNGRFRGRSRSRKGKRRTQNSPDWLCYYHYRYRAKANKCVKPCSWKDSSGN